MHQNKFYHGDGVQFKPFNIAAAITNNKAIGRRQRGKVIAAEIGRVRIIYRS